MDVTHLYKIITEQQHDIFLKSLVLPLSDTDQDFIHLAEEKDVQRIAKKFFSKDEDLWLLKLHVPSLEGRLKWETNNGGSQAYPHLYDGAIRMGSVLSITKLQI